MGYTHSENRKKLVSPNSFRRYHKCNMPPFPPYGAILTLVRVTGTIEIAQPLLNFFNKDPIKMSVYSDLYNKTWYFSESKTIDVQICLFSSSQTCYFGKHARTM
jgi:hypothetical protein